MKSIKRALISVSDKTGVVEFAKFLSEKGVDIISTGGTAETLKKAGVEVQLVSDLTCFSEILDGRVKTLHPKIYGGILARREVKRHQEELSQNEIPFVDLVIVNLYPFQEVMKEGASQTKCIENIDIGGPALIRAAAKNHNDVTIIVDHNDFEKVKEDMVKNIGNTSVKLRRKLAAKAFSHTANYDAIIAGWFADEFNVNFPSKFTLSGERKSLLRYGENPHQKAAFYVNPKPAIGVATAHQLQGKELSYNNIIDTNAAFELVSEFTEPTVAIIKHTNPCGVGTGKTVIEAYNKAFSSDSVSAFGGIIATNETIDVETATAISNQFAEVVIAPSIDEEARNIIAAKRNLRLLITGGLASHQQTMLHVRSVIGGFLVQEQDKKKVEDLELVTSVAPTEEQKEEMIFAFKVAKHVKSNAIVLTKDGQTIGIGAGQMSRVDSVRFAIQKAKNAGFSVEGSVMSSDAFFPFHDSVILAAENGVVGIIQPGGSIRDEEVIKASESKGIPMLLTGQRHFKH